ncbi:MAG: hypothetical protein L3J25_08950 [Flavobacteriaceae bacterium]|nr:hypothetical protein [Flavobacteriaceae bacterium]
MEKYLPIIIPIVLAIFAGLGWLYKHEKEKRVQVEKQLSEKKYNVYYKFISIFFDIFKSIKKGKTYNINSNVIDKLIDIKKDLIIYGSDEVIRKFFKWEEASNNSQGSLVPITDVIIEMRKDMGNRKTKITSKDFLKSVVADNTEYIELHKKGIV